MSTTSAAIHGKSEGLPHCVTSSERSAALSRPQLLGNIVHPARPRVRVERSHTVSTPLQYSFTPVTAVSEAPDPTPDRKKPVSNVDYGSRSGGQNLLIDLRLTIDEEEKDDATSIQGIGINDIEVGISAPDHLSEEGKARFNEMAKFCPTTLMNKDCVLFDRCALIQPCRKFSTLRWHNFCHHGDRCHNSHKVPYTCRSMFYNHECDKNNCEHSHDKAVRMAIEAFRVAHEKGAYGFE
ncbi:hypothetical protein VTO58DRAFT_102727 [Aureobasidium pullulans]|nr:hypothetical protein JADG_003573 [Aureobasidium pullulans]